MHKTRVSELARLASRKISRMPIYRKAIPLDAIFGVLAEHDLVPLQEDGTYWDGMLCGEEGRARFPLGDADRVYRLSGFPEVRVYEEVEHNLVLGWHRMLSGKYEITAYIS